jgi:hypothetical protein
MFGDLWRAWFSVPEAERLDERAYRRLVEKAKLKRGDAAWMIPAGVAFSVFVLWTVVLGVVASAVWSAAAGGAGTGVSRRLVGCSSLLAGALLASAVYAALRWVLLVRSMRRIINKAGCPFCEFSLVGLKPEDGEVRCPECGGRVVLAEHGLYAEDLLSPRERRRALPGAGPYGAYRGPGG